LERKRAILLLDDAALSLTPEYLVEFFDVFRSLKTINIAPKASVYPGTTVYGPRFHVGHDAEKVSSWLEIRNENYSQFMGGLIKLRSLDIDEINKDIVEIFKYAAFGIPRHFINLLRNYNQSQDKVYQQRFNNVIEQQAESIKVEYLSFTKKLPQYQNIINTGWLLHEKMVEIITIDNKNIAVSDEKQLQFSILKEHDLTRDRMFQFLIEAGLLYELEELKGGSNKVYKRYIPHLLFLVKSRAFSTGKGFKASEVIQFIKRREKKLSIRRELSNVLDSKDIELNLNLPSCRNCGAERLTEQQKFCHNCGKELVRQSTFDACMETQINELPFLTKLQRQRINEQTGLHTIGDFLLVPDPATKLRQAKQIGPIRADKIYKKVVDRIEEFLS
ncbi:MAG: zinc ribbon domain-containing protein, partial [Thiomargarita sp.]|nr:zinc ribbon domain-containing protein [Thiomargarita sp.]